jgi:hypothetical protein
VHIKGTAMKTCFLRFRTPKKKSLYFQAATGGMEKKNVIDNMEKG